MIKTFLILSLLITIVTENLRAQKEYKDSLDFKLTQAFSKTKIPGFTAIIINKNGIVYEKSLGYANSNAHVPYTTQTIENVGSVSKTFIAVALMKAIDLGYFTLSTNINDILPFKVTNPYFPNYPITIKQLTTHTSSIVDNDSIYNKSYKFIITDCTNKDALSAMGERGYSGGLSDTTLETFLHSYLKANGKLYSSKNFYNSKPGERSSYSNIASALAAYLIQLKAGMSFAAFSEKYILHPLHMNSSGWFLSDIDMQRHAVPYVAADFPLPFYSLTTYPDGGLITSADDLSKYELEMINSLNGHSMLLDNNSVEVMFSPVFSSDSLPENFNASKRTKGIFWNLYTDGFIGHDGDDPGVSTNILFNKNCGIIFMTNIYMDDRSDFVNPLKEYATKIAQE
ncbi:serine hydrolase domain-containing protein [Foetidibacter luteolus]|uniref:serine hydrolase domain-containing protein n=1 Tax=Foetidibacter luteolus TaxID=2608880 RepID=UPI00129A3F39|nr:serine hydrolase domain-containing protein [Foetidibacter luteolus]